MTNRKITLEEKERVDSLIQEGKPPYEIRQLTMLSLPFIYRRFRVLGYALPMERAGLIRPLNAADMEYIRTHQEQGSYWLSKNLPSGPNRINIIEGYLKDIAIETVFLRYHKDGMLLRQVAHICQVSTSRVQEALRRLGYRLEKNWVKDTPQMPYDIYPANRIPYQVDTSLQPPSYWGVNANKDLLLSDDELNDIMAGDGDE